MPTKKQKLVIIDSNALIHRAFHALPPTLSDSQGRPTNAVYGFTMILLKTLKDLKPDYLAAAFDLKGKTFRHEAYAGYKATRVKAPDELYEQIPIVKEVLRAFNIPIYEKPGFEADDIIGTIAHLKGVNRPDIETIIVTGDQDVLQLVDFHTKALSPHKGLSETILYNESEVKEKFGGLVPKQLIDYKALRGDASDNIPGVKGIGEKGAIELLNNFGTLENIYKNLNSGKIKDRTRELLREHQADALMSKKLATIITDVPIDFKLEDSRFSGYDQNAVIDVFQKLNFKSLLRQLSGLAQTGLQIKGAQGGLFDQAPNQKNIKTLKQKKENKEKDHSAARPFNQRIGKQDYRLIDNQAEVKKFISELKKQTEFCLDTETTSLHPLQAKLLGISFCWQAGEAYYLPQARIRGIKDELRKILSDKKIKKIGHNLKYDLEVLETYFSSPSKGEARRGSENFQTTPNRSPADCGTGFERRGINGIYFDTMIASYLLNPGHRQHNLDILAFVELGYQTQNIEELIGKPASASLRRGQGQDQITLADVPIEKVCWYSCEDADISFRLYKKFDQELTKQGMEGLFHDLEMPLVEVLSAMEMAGVKINSRFLNKLGVELGEKIKTIEKKVYKLAGKKFNLASPKQLKEILFEKMKIDYSGLAKTKTGISTGASELEKLSAWLRENKEPVEKRKVVDLILEFRELSKLKNTYLDALPKLVSQVDKRVHTSFNQTVTSTGRLSSSDPNLQNIPIRTEIGGQIRNAFIAETEFKILKADYSQIELRIIASLANDEAMLEIFRTGGDIHTQTAAIINGVKPEEVTRQMRRGAKEVNFGVLYGMGAWGLASRTGISNTEAQEFISKYFQAFRGVKKFIEETVELAKERGYVETLYGRRRYLPEINSGIQQVRSAAERMAINMPIQGTAADLIKLAMIAIYKDLTKVSPTTRMLLQVHDELLFEVPKREVRKVARFVRETMCTVMKLRAPIEAAVSVGDSWGETKEIKS